MVERTDTNVSIINDEEESLIRLNPQHLFQIPFTSVLILA